MNCFRAVSAAAVSLLLISAVYAEEQISEEKPISLGDVLISPRRIPGVGIEESKFAGSATVITEEEIRRSGASGVVEVLAHQPGISLIDSRGSGLGADSGIGLRGFANGSRTNTLVLVNGVRQNRITSDDIHWLSIPAEQIERIEIIRGGAGTIYGEGALGGVINIITKESGTRAIQAEGSAEAGSYLHRRATSIVRGAKDKFSYSLGVTRQEGGGYRDRVVSRGTTVNFFTGWDPAADTQLKLHVRHHADTSGFAGGITPQTAEADRRHAGTFSGFFDDNINEISGQLTQQIGTSWTVSGNIFVTDRDSDSATTSRFGSDTHTAGMGFRASNETGEGIWKLTSIAGTDLSKDKAVTGDRGSLKSESNRWAYGLFIEEALELYDRLTMTLGFRYDRSHYEEDLAFPTFVGSLHFEGRSPKIGINYEVNDQLSFYTSIARAFKAPNIDDLDAVLPPYNDSVGLKPQQADHFEAGVRWNPVRWFRTGIAGFVIHTKDEILFNPYTFFNANFTTQRAGLELNIDGQIKEVSYYATYTLMKALFHKGAFTGYEIPLVPRHRGTAGVRVPVVRNLSASVDLLLVGKQFRVNDFNNLFQASGYSVLDGTLEYKFPKVKAYFKVLNMLDQEYEASPASNGTNITTGVNPALPRTWVSGVSWEW